MGKDSPTGAVTGSLGSLGQFFVRNTQGNADWYPLPGSITTVTYIYACDLL